MTQNVKILNPNKKKIDLLEKSIYTKKKFAHAQRIQITKPLFGIQPQYFYRNNKNPFKSKGSRQHRQTD